MTSSASRTGTRLSHRINSVSIRGGFLDGVKLEFSPGLNCFIGGRGTGKTTVLELIRYAFDAFPSRDTDGDEWRRIDGLVEQNLGGGRVQVEIQTKNGLTYVVARAWNEETVILTPDGQPTQLTLKSGGVFRTDIFSQNEIERIADRTTSQLVLIDQFEADVLAEIDSQVRELEQQLSTNGHFCCWRATGRCWWTNPKTTWTTRSFTRRSSGDSAK